MIDFTVFRERLTRGWGLSLFAEQSLKNLNQFHVTYVLAEILLLCYVFPGCFQLLIFALLFHLLNLGLNLSDAANAVEHGDRRLFLKVYWGFELFIFCLGCIDDWQLMLIHVVSSYAVPLCWWELQNLFLRMALNARSTWKTGNKIAAALCVATNFIPAILLVVLWGTHFDVHWLVWLVGSAVYVSVIVPLMVEFEDSEENLFEFAFGLVN